MQDGRLSNTPTNEAELLSAATACAKRGEHDQAVLFLNALIDANWHHEIAMGMLAAIYAEAHKYHLAIECYRRVLKINPANVLARFQLGELLLTSKDARAVLQTWQPCLDEPDDFLAHYHSGLAWLQLGDTNNAHTLLQEAARRMPDDHPLHAPLRERLATLGV
jgi:tetratricopeptide (TPR) repeat protein